MKPCGRSMFPFRWLAVICSLWSIGRLLNYCRYWSPFQDEHRDVSYESMFVSASSAIHDNHPRRQESSLGTTAMTILLPDGLQDSPATATATFTGGDGGTIHDDNSEITRNSVEAMVVCAVDGTVYTLDAWTGQLRGSFVSGAPLVGTEDDTDDTEYSEDDGRDEASDDDDDDEGGENDTEEYDYEYDFYYDYDDENDDENDEGTNEEAMSSTKTSTPSIPSKERIVPGLDGELYSLTEYKYYPNPNDHYEQQHQQEDPLVEYSLNVLPMKVQDVVISPISTCRRPHSHNPPPTLSQQQQQERCGLVMGNVDTKVFALDPLSGTVRWMQLPNGKRGGFTQSQTAPHSDHHQDLDRGTVLLQREDYTVRHVDMSTGEETWKVTLGTVSALEFGSVNDASSTSTTSSCESDTSFTSATSTQRGQKTLPKSLTLGSQTDHSNWEEKGESPHAHAFSNPNNHSNNNSNDDPPFLEALPSLFFGDEGDTLVAIDPNTHAVLWQKRLSSVVAAVYGVTRHNSWVSLNVVDEMVLKGEMHRLSPFSDQLHWNYHDIDSDNDNHPNDDDIRCSSNTGNKEHLEIAAKESVQKDANIALLPSDLATDENDFKANSIHEKHNFASPSSSSLVDTSPFIHTGYMVPYHSLHRPPPTPSSPLWKPSSISSSSSSTSSSSMSLATLHQGMTGGQSRDALDQYHHSPTRIRSFSSALFVESTLTIGYSSIDKNKVDGGGQVGKNGIEAESPGTGNYDLDLTKVEYYYGSDENEDQLLHLDDWEGEGDVEDVKEEEEEENEDEEHLEQEKEEEEENGFEDDGTFNDAEVGGYMYEADMAYVEKIIDQISKSRTTDSIFRISHKTENGIFLTWQMVTLIMASALLGLIGGRYIYLRKKSKQLKIWSSTHSLALLPTSHSDVTATSEGVRNQAKLRSDFSQNQSQLSLTTAKNVTDMVSDLPPVSSVNSNSVHTSNHNNGISTTATYRQTNFTQRSPVLRSMSLPQINSGPNSDEGGAYRLDSSSVLLGPDKKKVEVIGGGGNQDPLNDGGNEQYSKGLDIDAIELGATINNSNRNDASAVPMLRSTKNGKSSSTSGSTSGYNTMLPHHHGMESQAQVQPQHQSDKRERSSSNEGVGADNLDGIPLVRYSRYRSEFNELSPLGKGGFGTVFKCTNTLDGRVYAVKKVLIKVQVNSNGHLTRHFSQKLHRVLREVKILALLDHPNIVRYYTAWLEVENEEDAAVVGSGVDETSSIFGTTSYGNTTTNGFSTNLLAGKTGRGRGSTESGSLSTSIRNDQNLPTGSTTGKQIKMKEQQTRYENNPLGWNNFLASCSHSDDLQSAYFNDTSSELQQPPMQKMESSKFQQSFSSLNSEEDLGFTWDRSDSSTFNSPTLRQNKNLTTINDGSSSDQGSQSSRSDNVSENELYHCTKNSGRIVDNNCLYSSRSLEPNKKVSNEDRREKSQDALTSTQQSDLSHNNNNIFTNSDFAWERSVTGDQERKQTMRGTDQKEDDKEGNDDGSSIEESSSSSSCVSSNGSCTLENESLCRSKDGQSSIENNDVHFRTRDSNKSISNDDKKDKFRGLATSTQQNEDSPIEEFKTQKHILYIQMQLSKKTLLDFFLSNEESKNKESDILSALRMFSHIASGVKHVHQQGLIHRDLKPSNCFMDDSEVVKIGDFGLSRESGSQRDDVENDGGSSNHNFQDQPWRANTAGVGTSVYASPEQINGSDYDASTDVFSLGIILFEMCYPMYTGMERIKAFEGIRKCVFPDQWYTSVAKPFPSIHNLLLAMLSHDPGKRPSSAAVASHIESFLSEEYTALSMNKSTRRQGCIFLRVEANENDGVLQRTIKAIKDAAPCITILQYSLRGHESKAIMEFALVCEGSDDLFSIDGILEELNMREEVKVARQVNEKHTAKNNDGDENQNI